MLSQLKGAPLALAVTAVVLFLSNLGGARLWDDDEPKNAACGREMYEEGNWTVPMYNNELRPHKPVLLYWAMIASYATVGVTEFGARLPSALAGIVTVLLCYQLGRKLYDDWAGLAAGVLLASGLMFAVLSRAATPDGVLIVCITGSLWCFASGVAELRGGHFSKVSPAEKAGGGLFDGQALPLGWTAGMYGCIGLAVLAKGPIGVLLPMSITGLYAVLARARFERPGGATGWKQAASHALALVAPWRLWSIARGMRVWTGAAIAGCVALPWYAAVTYATGGEWLAGFLGTHNMHRFMRPMEGHSGPVFYYLIAIMAGFFPGSCFLPVALVRAVREQRGDARLQQSHLFLLCWVACYLIVFTAAATKLPNYIVPCFPAVALLTGCWLADAARSGAGQRFWLRLGLSSLAVVGVVLTAGLAYVASRYLDSDWTIPVAGLAPVAGAAVALVLLRRDQAAEAAMAFAATCVVFSLLATGVTAPRISPYQTSPRVALRLTEIEEEYGTGPVNVATYRYTKPNVVYYLGRPVPKLENDTDLVEHLSTRDGLAVLPLNVYESLSDRLPPGVGVVHTEPRFFKPGQAVVIVGRAPAVAHSDGHVERR